MALSMLKFSFKLIKKDSHYIRSVDEVYSAAFARNSGKKVQKTTFSLFTVGKREWWARYINIRETVRNEK